MSVSGMSWPPRLTRKRTRARCRSGLDSPAYQTLTSSPAESACSRSRVIVSPPRVVSNANERRLRMARSSRRFPSRHEWLLASRWVRAGSLISKRRATSSGLKYSLPALRSIAPAMLLLPPPFVPASTVMQALGAPLRTPRGSSATVGRRDGRATEFGRRSREQGGRPRARLGCLHALEHDVELFAQRVEVRRGPPCQRFVRVGRQQHRRGRVVLGDHHAAAPQRHVEHTAELVLRDGRGHLLLALEARWGAGRGLLGSYHNG